MSEIEQAIEYLEPIAKHPTMTGNYCKNLKVALTALREKAERERGCGFCCYQEYPDKTLYPKEGYAFYAGFSKQIDVNDFDEIEIDEIKYCPICSRRLEVAHELSNL